MGDGDSECGDLADVFFGDGGDGVFDIGDNERDYSEEGLDLEKIALNKIDGSECAC